MRFLSNKRCLNIRYFYLIKKETRYVSPMFNQNRLETRTQKNDKRVVVTKATTGSSASKRFVVLIDGFGGRGRRR